MIFHVFPSYVREPLDEALRAEDISSNSGRNV